MSQAGIVPYFGYDDGRGAMTFLEQALGFERMAAYDDDSGKLLHGEIGFSGGFIMLGTSPDRQSGAEPPEHGVYCVVDDVDAHYQRAKSAGAHIVYPPEDTDFGTRRYRAMDPEGYEWTFGTYAPGNQ